MSKYIDGVSDKYDYRFARLVNEDVIFVHIDTTGLDANKDHITRLSIFVNGMMVYCVVFKCDTSFMGNKAIVVSGLTKEEINASDVTFEDEKVEIGKALSGRLICCTNKDFLLAFLSANGIILDRDDVIDLKAVVGMMNHTYSRTTMADVLCTLLSDEDDKNIPNTTYERNFYMYNAACRLKEMIIEADKKLKTKTP